MSGGGDIGSGDEGRAAVVMVVRVMVRVVRVVEMSEGRIAGAVGGGGGARGEGGQGQGRRRFLVRGQVEVGLAVGGVAEREWERERRAGHRLVVVLVVSGGRVRV